jgi:hypothetical protein
MYRIKKTTVLIKPEPTKIRFFRFRQNNSHGVWVRDENIDINVFIEASSSDEANERMNQFASFGDGCPCCGERWSSADDADGSVEPLIWGKTIEEHLTERKYQSDDERVIIHYLDGRRETYEREEC